MLLIGAAAPHRQVLLPRMEHQTKRKGGELSGDVGGGVWSPIQQSIGQLGWRVLDEAKKGGGLWSVNLWQLKSDLP